MASIKLVKAIKAIIDPGWQELEGDEAQALEEDVLDIIEAVEEHQGSTQRLLVVGQIQYADQEEVYTVALGPFGARGKLDTPEKFKKAAEDSTAAHEKGGRLAWDTKTGRGKGRYMVVPLFRTPMDAWNFYRASSDIDPDELTENIQQAVTASIRGTEMDQILPSCTCGVKPESGHRVVQGVRVTRKCFRHNVLR